VRGRRGPDALSVDEIVALLAGAADVPLGAGSVSQLDHAVQTASLLANSHPDRPELAAAGLVHDIGHLLPGVTDRTHATAGAHAIRPALGGHVAALVALHVEAKQYLVTTEPEYAGALAPDSTTSLVHQGGTLSAAAVRAFRRKPLAAAALVLRRADDRAKVVGARVAPLAHWADVLRGLSRRSGGTGA
jgi:predicted HD phosphohydrolase